MSSVGNSARVKNMSKGGGGGTHRNRVNGADYRRKLYNEKLSYANAQLLRPGETDITNKNQYDVANTYVGHWARGSPLDEEFKARRELLQRGNPNYGATPYGIVSVDPDQAIAYMNEKKSQEQWMLETQLGSYLVDPKRPETQEKAFTMFPELTEYPDAHHTNLLAMQESLRQMLKSGTIGSKDDHAMVLEMVRQDFRMPLFPAWDPEGLTLGAAVNAIGNVNVLMNMKKKGLFNFQKRGLATIEDYGANGPTGGVGPLDAETTLQLNLKVAILKRLYPGLRDKEYNRDGDKAVFDYFIKRQSPLEKGTVITDRLTTPASLYSTQFYQPLAPKNTATWN
jgi:hypothetical protein